MIYELNKNERQSISSLFSEWNETMIWSCLQGYMGKAYVTDKNEPKSAMITLGDFSFLAGIPDEEIACELKNVHHGGFALVVPRTEDWNEVIESIWGEKAEKTKRYAIKKELEIFDIVKLEEYAEVVSKEYDIQRIDEKLYHEIMKLDWCRDFCAVFADCEDYIENGLGFVALKDGEIVAGASSYSAYKDGIEIEIDTKEEYREKGLAKACGAKLILECLKLGKYPSWDAIDMRSVHLAEKLGYHMDREYTTYSIEF